MRRTERKVNEKLMRLKKKERTLQSLAISTPILFSPSHAPLFSRFRAKFVAVLHRHFYIYIYRSYLHARPRVTRIHTHTHTHTHTRARARARAHIHLQRDKFILTKWITGSGECKYKLSASHHS